jgi:hypothetical protein
MFGPIGLLIRAELRRDELVREAQSARLAAEATRNRESLLIRLRARLRPRRRVALRLVIVRVEDQQPA